ncbi:MULTISPECIES: hypothetical protein [unclassified Pseudoclavibacter]|uniref:hypothetical protein n=1 Tax=unclassified Pseudoclavibacter TaxID=2615177 RepID=UPI000CE74DE2|nr:MULTISPECIES: hypothetical protein [unclassified Pseudoclavibacter]MBS3180449.1 hypothetical protein [Pseudoclavibacter sp. Marseille-Q4354]PPG33367.1 hypothetical protein C5B97_01775 [Pseudoclavibacter sp. RFBB5]
MAIEQWIVDGPRVIDVQTVRSVRARLAGGAISVLAHDEPSTRIEVSAITGRDLKIAIDGDQLLIDHPQLSWTDVQTSAKTIWNQPTVVVSVLVPAGVDVDILGVSSEVLVAGIDGRIDVNTVGGEQFLDATQGELHLNSIGGEISVRGHAGKAVVKTASGDVTATGPIVSFDGSTVSGATIVDVTSGSPTLVANRSVSGATTVRLPSGTHPSYQVSTVGSSVQLDGLHLEPLRGTTYRSEPVEGEVTDVRISTVTGRVSVMLSARTPRAGDTPADFDERIDARIAPATEDDHASTPAAGTAKPDTAGADAEPGGNIEVDASADADTDTASDATKPGGTA